MTTQTEFAAALLDADCPCPDGLVACNGSELVKRFSVYRNNIVTSLIDALADTFLVVHELVGDEFFRAMAQVFVSTAPPRSPVMAAYGLELPAFIDRFEPALSIPYLADVARLEALRIAAYHAADAQLLDEAVFQDALAHTESLPTALLRLHPSASVLRSQYAVFSLWAAHQGAFDIGTVDPYRSEDVLIVRPHLEVLTVPLRPGAGWFIQQLGDGVPLGQCALAASEKEPGFDLGNTLADLIRVGVAITFDYEEEILT